MEYIPPDHTWRPGPSAHFEDGNVHTPRRKRAPPRTQEDEIYELKGKVQVLLESAIGDSRASKRSRREDRYPLDLIAWQNGEAPGATVDGIFFRGKSFMTQYHGPSHLFSFVGEASAY